MQTPALPAIVRTTVPETPEAMPALAALVSPITGGLPHAMVLNPQLTLGLVAPTGLARFWLSVPAETVVSESLQPAADIPLRLLLRGSRGALTGIAPLVAGPVRFAGATGEVAPELRLRITGWRIPAGSLVGAGDFGSFIALDWSRPSLAGATTGPAARFAAPVARDAVQRRLARDAQNHAAAVIADAAPGPGTGKPLGYLRRFADD